MPELSGFTAAQPLANIGPQSLRLPTSLADVCNCESGCGASQILRGLAQIVRSRITHLIEIDVQAVDTPDGVRVAVIPWAKDGVAKNGVAIPGGWIALDGTEVVGMSNDEYASRWTNNIPLEWDNTITATINDDGTVTLTFPQPTSANRPFTYTATQDGKPIDVTQTITDGTVTLTTKTTLAEKESATFAVHVATQYHGINADSTATITRPATQEPEPEPEPEGDTPA